MGKLFELLVLMAFGGAVGAGVVHLGIIWIEHEQKHDPKRSTTSIVAEIVGIVGGVVSLLMLLKQ